MKLGNLLALPIALIADAVTFGEAGVTRSIFRDERDEREIEVIKALAEVAKVSYLGNQQHNPGQQLHWARGKSTDQADTIIRHFMERGEIDTDGMRHSAKLAWRALALLQLELEAAGAPLARGAKL